ncbi:lysylphosphatidylglycerol synthase domain-containing protein [Yersinia bercovieri]|uniref:lysylphosphatidylglycerol synthase domain-containing protein n=1 Tax=Yersinia bercovieri TaxID=634 RepID=UPI0005E01A3B|nr:lysylphosphatidylglycerol synthase domain-containing protein [Yersinia bercovieri]CFQ31119.1 Uncharacterised protein family (UPF0104) [Yersinia bercovieri]
MSQFINRLIKYSGSILAILGLVFIFLKLYKYDIATILSSYTISDWLLFSGLILVYGFANIILSLAWWYILSGLGVKVDVHWTIKTYAVSQISKYVPGNIFQFVGRQALGMAKELPAWLLAKSSIWEIGLLAVAGSLFGFFVLPVFMKNNYTTIWVCLFLFLLTLCLAFFSIKKYLNPKFSSALLCHVGFLIISSLLFLILACLQDKSFEIVSLSNVFIICGAYIVAWLAGLITPGSPAGVGVRELVLLFLLSGIIQESNLVTVIILGRLVTIGGDIVFYFSLAMNRAKSK